MARYQNHFRHHVIVAKSYERRSRVMRGAHMNRQASAFIAHHLGIPEARLAAAGPLEIGGVREGIIVKKVNALGVSVKA